MGGRLQYEQFGNNKLWFLYDADGLPAGVRYDDGTAVTYYYYVCNWRGDVVSLHSDTSLVCKYDYDAWGNVTSVKDADGTSITSSTHIANINPIRYRGYYYDNETNLYYLASRYYDPQIRRFINADDILVLYDDFNSYNVFIYCSNNPTVSSDATGHLTFTWRYKYNPMNVKIAKNQKQPVDPKSPPPPSSGYVPPKSNKNPGKVPNPNGSGKGWPSKDGGVWIPNNKQHGGPGWTVQYPNGQHEHRYPDGHVRKANINYSQLKTAIELTIISIAIVGIVADDITGIGIADNDMLNTVIPLFHERWSEVIA